MSAWTHFTRFGMAEGRKPRADFDPEYYRSCYRDEIGSENPFRHWALIGKAKGFKGHPWIADPTINDIALMRAHFDEQFYQKCNADVARVGIDLFQHFLLHGWKEGRNPAPWFNLNDYAEMNPDVAASGLNIFSHYVVVGQHLGLITSRLPVKVGEQDERSDPFTYDLLASEFDSDFYRSQFALGSAVPSDCIAHYIREGAALGLDPNKWFSTVGYLDNNEDVRAAGINPFFHYLSQGIDEGRSYELRSSVPTNNPGQAIKTARGFKAEQTFSEHLQYTSPGPDFELLDTGIIRSRAPRAKLLAYYLPQFHAIPENDAWWGLGFTEWRNIIRGQPRYRGHQQPRVPEQLGFYDLNDINVLKKQVELARVAGVYGFCFYYYNFNGRRILEKPIEAILSEKSIDFPFCLMWANENWTRTWDGFDRAVLLQQDYRKEDDAAFVTDVARHFKDTRYIRVNDRPLFFIYRPGQIPMAKERIREWRGLWESVHKERPLIFMVQGFDDVDPRAYELDGAIEFPPHKICANMQPLNPGLELFDPDFSGHVVSYAEAIERSVREAVPEFPLIKTAAPSWDNEARRPGRGMTLQGSTPARYERWLRALVEWAQAHPVYGENFVAVNAWNEWAEGAYLEPDVYHGAAYLNSTARALAGAPSPADLSKHSLLVIGHDAYRHGAQILVRNLIETFSRQFGFNVHLGVCGEGPMLEEYRELALSCSTIPRGDIENGHNFARRMAALGVNRAIVNTTVAGWIVPILRDAGFTVTSLIHELPQLISEYKLGSEATMIAERANTIVFPAKLVRDAFFQVSGPSQNEDVIQPQGLYRRNIRPANFQERARIRTKLGLPANAKLVINVGYADMRKGFDIFLRIARALCAKRSDVYFAWVGSGTSDATRWQMSDIVTSGFSNRIYLTGYTDAVADYYAAADAFFLTSREDPFPSVVLEALASGLPIVGTNGHCGTNEIIEAQGQLIDMNDDASLITALELAFDTPKRVRRRGEELVREHFRFDDYCFSLLRYSYRDVPKVSVVVPNYNYGNYLEARLQSIFRQTHPVFEVIVLDDASNDDSLDVIRTVTANSKRQIELITNKTNSGSVFRQWRKGIEAARGDYVWIAEADDDAEETFLQVLLSRMVRDGASLGFSDSWQVGSQGERLGESYKPYLSEEAPGSFESSFSVDGRTFLRRYLALKNVILNVSSVVFNRLALLRAMEAVGDDLFSYKVAGDWRLYVEICSQENATVTYEAKPLNGHRRHQSSVTHSLNNSKHFSEIRDIHARVDFVSGPLPRALLSTREAYLKKIAKYLGLGIEEG